MGNDNIRVALVNVPGEGNATVDKDLVGGIGQIWEVGDAVSSKIISFMRKGSVNLPVLSLAYVLAILKKTGVYVKYYESLPAEEFDVVFVYGTMVDHEHENAFAKEIKERYPNSKVGFIGPFPSKYPEYFKSDFVIAGETESFFLYRFLKDKDGYNGVIRVVEQTDMDDLPTPDFESFPVKSYSYLPALDKKPFLTLQASRGCPYSCRYYCAYGSYQGGKYRKRSPEKLLEDIKTLIKIYGVKSLQFRDPTFGLDKQQVEKLCNLIVENGVNIEWGIETRMDILNKEIIKIMFDAGLRNINVGVETVDPKIAEINKRKLSEVNHQEEIVEFCRKLGVKISAFYIFGYEGDTEKSVKNLIDYAIKLNTNGARFAISTPFPGTDFFESLKGQGKIKTFNFKEYNSFNLVFEHGGLTSEELAKLRDLAFRKYYFRIGYLTELLRWKLREVLSPLAKTLAQ